MPERLDREMPVWERILRRDQESPRRYHIVGDHPDDATYYDVAFDDGFHVAVPMDQTWRLPQLEKIHDDVRRQCRELGIDLTA